MSVLGITMGDAAGVGPEIALRSYAEGKLPENCLVIGDLSVLEQCRGHLGLDVRLSSVEEPVGSAQALSVLDCGLLAGTDVPIGQVDKATGHAALMYVERAAKLALDSQLLGIVTLPMNKQATRLSHGNFTGHTEFIADLCDCRNYTMMLASEELIVTHVSTHVALRVAIEMLRSDRVWEVIRLTADAVERLGRNRRIAVLGLNPHAGEEGAFGCEEGEGIVPAVERAKVEGIDAVGPLPPDTVFGKAIRGEFGAVVCMYHDQGHIPMKMIGFDRAVNVTLGLPIVRTSVDHGTAFDIAWQGKASVTSLVNACTMAGQLAGPAAGEG
jgi:4-hydroxythreonine-4-phosphate dehydrogenase